MCKGFNLIGEAAGEMGFRAGVHNHLDDMVEGPAEVDTVSHCLECEVYVESSLCRRHRSGLPQIGTQALHFQAKSWLSPLMFVITILRPGLLEPASGLHGLASALAVVSNRRIVLAVS